MFRVLKGMRVTFKNIWKKSITLKYPFEKYEMTPRFRGALQISGMLGEPKTCAPSDEMPPCMNRCPANVDARGYINLVAKGKFREAFNLHLESNPLPSICGRVCPHPCEDECRRGWADQPVQIAAIKRYMGDMDAELAKTDGPSKAFRKIAEKKSDKVAVVGAGPAGLAAAYYLARWGYQVTIYEKLPVPGGMLYVGIPAYRLPRDVIMREVKNIEDMGVKINYKKALGKDFTVDSLLKDGFKAVVVAVGAHKVIKMKIEGEELKGVIPGESFLADVALGKEVKIGKKVIVVGGGNTAIDCARSARRIGANDVTIVYRRTQAEMPAHEFEIEDAMHEGVKFEFLANPAKIIGRTGNVIKVECTRMELGPPDESGRRSPIPKEGAEFIMETDEIISAISRVPDLGQDSKNWAEEAGIEFNERRFSINADKQTGVTSREGVFACGDLVTGPDIAIQAIAGGRNVAQNIHQYLSGTKETLKKSEFTEQISTKPRFNEALRYIIPEIPVPQRPKDFSEVQLGFNQEQAVAEAERCLSCNSRQCIGCQICERNCPIDAIEIKVSQNGRRSIDEYNLSLDRCIFCGICSEYCPTRTLTHSSEYELAVDVRDKLLYNKSKMLRQ
ncbi:MAG: FAD-dependent oxidoreductase [Actinobacteria bacterium]|nr:MAG: FAD-dependent oxidoreductase [Actinomycetota bacterium]